MPALSQEVQAKMREKAQAVRDRMAHGAAGPRKRLDLTGKNALVPPGAAFVGRCLPRWDIATKWIKKDGKWAVNPHYNDDLIYFPALEHWLDDASGKTIREWCPKTFDEAAPCPLCEASEALKASAEKAERDVGYRMAAKEVFLFNFILGPTGKRQMTDEGKPDIRILPAPNTVFVAISAFMTGGVGDETEAQQFARGDISDPREGYDLKTTRPSGQGDRWKVDCAPQPSPLYGATEAAAWGGESGLDWMKALINLPEVVRGEVKPYDSLYKEFYGKEVPSTEKASPPDPAAPPPPASPTEAPAPDPWATAFPAEHAVPPFDPPGGAGKTLGPPPRRWAVRR